VSELEGQSIAVEKSLQSLIENNSEEFLGVRFLKSEYGTGKQHSGRIDTLGIDENNSPVIIEYKRSTNENVINQGLFYLDWLLDHKAEFQAMVMEKYGKEDADNVEWDSARLICIAGGYTKYDAHAVKQIDRNIELLRYRKYGEEMFLLELVNSTSGAGSEKPLKISSGKSSERNKKATVSELYEKMSQDQKDRYESLMAFIYGLGDDIQDKTLKNYVAFYRIKNFACIVFHPNDDEILLYLKVNPDTVSLEEGFSRDVRVIGHYGTGDLEIRVSSDEDMLKVEPLILKSYDGS
jgi:predicted transport protein